MRRILIRVLIESPFYFARRPHERLQHLKFLEGMYSKTLKRESHFPPPVKKPPEPFPWGSWQQLRIAQLKTKSK